MASVTPIHSWSRSLKWVVAIRRNGWSPSIGMSGRDQSEALVAISRCAHLPVRSRREAIEKLEWYAMRWKIEVFHKILKSGCKAEESSSEPQNGS
jgi:hypothetical protein